MSLCVHTNDISRVQEVHVTVGRLCVGLSNTATLEEKKIFGQLEQVICKNAVIGHTVLPALGATTPHLNVGASELGQGLTRLAV